MSLEVELHTYLRTQFSDLAGAKRFMRRWLEKMDQEIPGFGCISSRALAAHCSAVLEGSEVSSLDTFTNYLESKYGRDLYNAAWADDPAS